MSGGFMSSSIQIDFLKMHGLKNSFVLISDLSNYWVESSSLLAKDICSPQSGIGADGVVFLRPGDVNTDFTMDYYNADGSKAEMCGNAIRCLAKMVVDVGIAKIKEPMQFSTSAGVITATVLENCLTHGEVRVVMGVPDFKAIPGHGHNGVVYEGYRFKSVSLGNPHVVTFVNNLDFDYPTLGEKLQQEQSLFPEGVNVEFAEVLSSGNIKVRVIERGVGETMACGTGACAVAAQYLTQLSEAKSESVIISLLGGDLKIEWDGKGPMIMEGPASLVAKGIYHHVPLD